MLRPSLELMFTIPVGQSVPMGGSHHPRGGDGGDGSNRDYPSSLGGSHAGHRGDVRSSWWCQGVQQDRLEVWILAELCTSKRHSQNFLQNAVGAFEFLVMLFSVTNAPPLIMFMMNDLFKHYLDQFVVVMLDNILVYSANKEEHSEHLKKFLSIL